MIRNKSKNATKLIVKAVFVKAAIFKSVVFNGKVTELPEQIPSQMILYWCQKHWKMTVIMSKILALLFLKKV